MRNKISSVVSNIVRYALCFQETQKKMRGVLTDDEKLTRSRAKIIGLTSASMGPTWDSYSDMEKRHCVR